MTRDISTPDTTESEPGRPRLTIAQAVERVGDGAFTVRATTSDLRYRVVVVRRSATDPILMFALPLEDVDETMQRLIQLELAAFVMLLAILSLVTFWVLRLGVRPLRQMTATASAIGQGDLSQRIPEGRRGTEAGELGAALNQMLARIEAAFVEKGHAQGRLQRFVADASHELRTPVTTIRGYAELHRMGALGEDAQVAQAMTRIEEEAQRMSQLVQDLLDLASLDRGRPLHLEAVRLDQLAADAVADARAVEPGRPIELIAPVAVTIPGDDHRLRQVFANLVGNARVHTPPGTRIEVRVEARGDQAVIVVRDWGTGMAPQDAERAFERFYRADPSRTRNTGGTGLGLSLVATMVHAHGGSVSLHSTEGEGTSVEIILPQSPAGNQP